MTTKEERQQKVDKLYSLLEEIRLVESLKILKLFREDLCSKNKDLSPLSDSQLLEYFFTGKIVPVKDICYLRKIFLFEAFKVCNRDKIKSLVSSDLSTGKLLFPEVLGFSSLDFERLDRLIKEQTQIDLQKAKKEEMEAQKNRLQSRLLKSDDPNEREALQSRISQLQTQIRRQDEIIRDLYQRLQGTEEKVLASNIPSEPKLGSTILSTALSTLSLSNLANMLLGPVAGYVAGGLALASGLKKLGKIVYERYFSNASKNCVGLSGASRTECIVQSKLDALTRQANAIRTYQNRCSKTKDPQECNRKVADMLSDIQKQIALQRARLLRLRMLPSE